ncbi:MAG: diguanylate cyclase [Myxococcales bacterium]|nr:diguanylate cyclase [Myxococcales bacterium]
MVRILLADDDPVDRAILTRWLERWGYQVTAASDGEEALAMLAADPSIRICVVDWVMPKIDGVEVCRHIRRQHQEPYVYTILLTGKTQKEDVVRGIEAGADDYIIKPCNPLELEVRLRAGRRVIDLQQDLILSREALRQKAMRDPLTGLLNRAALFEHLEKELTRAQRTGGSLCAVMIDVDFFKHINDEHGHLTGDSVLRDLAGRLESVLRTYDAVGRFGGEEFLMILANCDSAYGQAVAERLRGHLAAQRVRVDGRELAVTASFGVAATENRRHFDAETLIRAADAALYRAKAAGRDRVCVARSADWLAPPPSSRVAPHA